MIFVTLGTQKFPFDRLIKMVDQLVCQGVISEEVIMQTGTSQYQPLYCQSAAYYDEATFHKLIEQSHVVIAHAGVGTIMSVLQAGKKLIVIPRDERYQEHVDHHQYQIARQFTQKHYLMMAEDQAGLVACLSQIESFEPEPYVAKQHHIHTLIADFIKEEEKMKVLMVGSDLSVKGGIVSVLKNYLNCPYWQDSQITFIPTHIEGSASQKIRFFLASWLKIRKVLRHQAIQIVHIHVSERGSFFRKALILKMAKRAHCRVILHHHGAEFESFYQASRPFIQRYIQRVLEAADMNIVLSQRLVGMIKNITPKAAVHVLYNAVDMPDHNPYCADASEITMLGRLEERKGTFDLLHTIKMLDDQLPPHIRFNLCGDGDLAKVQAAIDELQIAHRIAHLGWIDGQQKQDILQRSMCHVLFSYNEGLPMAILETMAHGIVNISTNIASIPEVIIPQETGFLVEPGDRKALAQTILLVTQQPSLREKISQQSYEFIRTRFSLKQSIAQVEALYTALLKED